jgi:hypothetical protein
MKVGDYGPVRITGGKHLGKFGFYDNEDEGGAVVYLEGSEPLSGDYVIIPFAHLEHLDVSSFGVERFKREHPELARQAGIE